MVEEKKTKTNNAEVTQQPTQMGYFIKDNVKDEILDPIAAIARILDLIYETNKNLV